MIPTGRQSRKGRALAGLSQVDLAAAADVAVGLIVRIEASDGSVMARRPDLVVIAGALDAAGVGFIPADGSGTVVQLRKGEP